MVERVLMLCLAAIVGAFLFQGCCAALREAGLAASDDQDRFFDEMLQAIVSNPLR